MAHVTLQEQLATFLSLNLADPEDSEPLHGVRNEASSARSRAEQMVMCTNIHTLYSVHSLSSQSSELSTLETTLNKKFTPSDGPFHKSLEQCLKGLNVKWQANQGSTFVGNHVHKLL